jgi:hypothetical protein
MSEGATRSDAIKLVIRNLPYDLLEQEFLDILTDIGFDLEEFGYIAFYPGKQRWVLDLFSF